MASLFGSTEQFARQDRERERLQEKARDVAVTALTQSVHVAGSTLGVIHKALNEKNSIMAASYRDDINFGLKQLQIALDHWGLKEVVKELSAGDRIVFLMIVSTMGTVVNIANREKPIGWNVTFDLRQQKTALEVVHKCLSAFDAGLAEQYAHDGGLSLPEARPLSNK